MLMAHERPLLTVSALRKDQTEGSEFIMIVVTILTLIYRHSS